MTIRSFTIATSAILLGLTFAAGAAQTQSSDAMQTSDTMKTETMKKDNMKTDSMMAADTKADCMHKADMEKDSMMKADMMKTCDAMK